MDSSASGEPHCLTHFHQGQIPSRIVLVPSTKQVIKETKLKRLPACVQGQIFLIKGKKILHYQESLHIR